MGCYDVWCPLCGGPLNGVYDVDELSEKIKRDVVKKSKWMKKVTLLLPNKTIMGTVETSCNSSFAKGDEEHDFYMDEDFVKGVGLHDDCWRIAKKQKEKLSYQNFEEKYIKNDILGFAVEGVDYKPIDKYWSQTFEVDKLLKDKNDYLLESPLKSKRNEDRVVKNIKKIMKSKKIMPKSKRPSPAESATKFRVATKRRGGDGNIWVVSKTKTGVKRWKKL